MKYVRDLPELTGSYRQAFDGHIFVGSYRPGEVLYQVQRTGSSQTGRWFTPIRPLDPKHADELLNINKWGNDGGQIKTYILKEHVSGYAGKVSGGEGHQFYIPDDVPLNEILEEISL